MGSSDNQSSSNNKGIIDQTRNMIHNAVSTESEKQAEANVQKTFTEKAKDMVPENAQAAGQTIGKTIDDAVTDVKTKFQERIDEGTEREAKRIEEEKEKNDQQQQKHHALAGNPIGNVRENIYEMTKSPEVLQAEREANKGVMEKVEDKLAEAREAAVEKQKRVEYKVV